VSVRFTDESSEAFGEEYIHEKSQIGAVYIPRHGVVVSEGAQIRYEIRPWIEHFEFDGIKPSDVCCIWTPPTDPADGCCLPTDSADGSCLPMDPAKS